MQREWLLALSEGEAVLESYTTEVIINPFSDYIENDNIENLTAQQ